MRGSHGPYVLSFQQHYREDPRTFVDLVSDPVTSVHQTKDGNGFLVSTLDSTIRLLDTSNGQLLQSYKGHANTNYRIRSCLGLADAVVVSGSEDCCLYAWDLLEGTTIARLEAHSGKVSSAVAWNNSKREWASAGTDGNNACVSHLRYLSADKK